MQILKGVGIWILGAFVALIAMILLSKLHSGSNVPVTYLAYLAFWVLQFAWFSLQGGVVTVKSGRASDVFLYMHHILKRLSLIYIGVTILLLVDAVFDVKVGRHWGVFCIALLLPYYLIIRNNNRKQATGLLRGGRANIGEDKKRKVGPTGRYDKVQDQPEPVGAPPAPQRPAPASSRYSHLEDDDTVKESQ